eukprot:1229210-Rhodomonas_salina.1
MMMLGGGCCCRNDGDGDEGGDDEGGDSSGGSGLWLLPPFLPRSLLTTDLVLCSEQGRAAPVG